MKLRSFGSKITPLKSKFSRYNSSSVLSSLMTDLSEKYNINSRISSKRNSENIKHKTKKKNYLLSKFNIKDSIKSLKTSCNTPNITKVKSDFLVRKPLQEHGYDYKMFADKIRKITIQNLTPKTLKKFNAGIIHTKTKMEFTDESTNKIIKIKSFKEDDLPFTKGIKLPDIIWQELDNDVLTDEEQKKNAFLKEQKWLSETFDHMKKDKSYLNKNLGIIKYDKNIIKCKPYKERIKNIKDNKKKYKEDYQEDESDSDYIPDESTLIEAESD